MKHYLLLMTLMLCSVGISVYASGNNDYISIISGKKEYYHNRALEKELLSLGNKNNLQVVFNYTDKKDNSLNLIKDNIENAIPLNILSLNSNEQLQNINDTIKQQGTLEHSLVDYTLVTAQFFSSLIFIDALPKETLESFVPWGFVGYDISAIVDLQLSYLRKTSSNNTILVLLLNRESNFENMWLETLEKNINSDEKVLVEYLEHESTEDIMQLFENKNYYTKDNLGILTLYDYIAIRAGITLINMGNTSNYKIVGFGGSPEADLAITKNIIHMSIVPDYEEYGTKIITLAKKLQQRKTELIADDYHIDTVQQASNKEFISVSTIQ